MLRRIAIVLLATAAACKGRDRERSGFHSEGLTSVSADNFETATGGGAAMALDEGKLGDKDDANEKARDQPAAAPKSEAVRARGDVAEHASTNGVLGSTTPGAFGGKGGGNRGSTGETATRAWFPETFLFEPLIVTDAQGAATVPVRVPDRLTTWHVLALAHSREGAQGGAVASFLGTLPTYVDLVTPKFMVAGDEIKLPIQIVNTTASAAASTLEVTATNATIHGATGVRSIPAQGSIVDYATLRADHAGMVEVHASLGSTDAVLRGIEVRPAGRPVTSTKSGTLAAPRTLSLQGPIGADPSTDRVRLQVFPGALALLRSELGVSTFREGVADDAYTLLLAGKATALLASLGDQADPEVIRSLSILAGQRALRDARTLDVGKATLLTEAALAHPNNPVLARLGERAASFLVQHQRPDGTFDGETGWTLQRVLVASADATRAVASATSTAAERQRAMGVAARARGAFERNLEQVHDPFTAAAILASGAVDGVVAEKLRGLVRAGIMDAGDGAKRLAVGPGVVRADGSVPSTSEATALAVLALEGDPKAPLADLGATLLGSYNVESGWGDGRANLTCMRAVLALFKTPVPEGVQITLTRDGVPITSGKLTRAALREVLTLEAPAGGLAGTHEWKLVAEPAVPGLGYALTLRSWVPWGKETTHDGLELALPPSVTGQVGKPVELSVTAIAPSGIALHLEQSLPAGVQVDTPSLEALVAAGTIRRFTASEGKLELEVPPLEPGQTFAAKYRVIPTLAGKLHSAASKISAGTNQFHVPPTEWTIQ